RELVWLGGDPLRDDWRGFRPLVVGREEAWSDWLAHLLASGNTEFLRRLFGIPELPAVAPRVSREQELLVDQADRSQGNYRSDIILQWPEPMLGIHVEVKVGIRISKRPGPRRSICGSPTGARGTTSFLSCPARSSKPNE